VARATESTHAPTDKSNDGGSLFCRSSVALSKVLAVGGGRATTTRWKEGPHRADDELYAKQRGGGARTGRSDLAGQSVRILTKFPSTAGNDRRRRSVQGLARRV